MSDKPEKTEAAPAAAPAPAGEAKKASPSFLKSTPALLGGVMLIEAVVLFGGFKFLSSGPKTAHGVEVATTEPSDTEGKGESKGEGHEEGHGEGHAAAPKTPKGKLAELPVVDFKAPNKLSGHTSLYDVSIYVTVKGEHKEKAEIAIKTRDATIKDRIRTIIAQSDPERLGGGSEPGLETLRRQVKFQLEELIGPGIIEEVLIPRCIPYRTEF